MCRASFACDRAGARAQACEPLAHHPPWRARCRLQSHAEGARTGPESSMVKVFWSELDIRMHELAEKNQADELTPAEEIELQSYLKVGLFLDLIHARARRSLQAPARRR